MSPATSTPAQNGQGASFEYKARDIARALKASNVPFGFLVAAARNCLVTGTPPRDATVIAGAKRLQKQQRDAVERWRKGAGLPPIGKASGGEG